MIERIEFEDWDGIAAGALHPLSSRTVLVCSDERCRGAILGALGFFRIEEQFADVYERIWRRSRPIGAAILASLVPEGRATIRARVDGRELWTWMTSTGGWGWARSKLTVGDFNGDGKSELAVLYDYGNDQTALFVFNSEGTAAYATWITSAGGWGWNRSKITVGDFNGDGRSEIAIFYDYSNDTSGLAYFNSAGTAAQRVFLSGAGNWSWARSLLGG